MDNNTAKLILGVYRASGDDAQDPFFKDALQHAENDPFLRQWFSEQLRQDGELAGALRNVPVPNDGKAAVLAIMGTRPRPRRRWWPMALAACFAFFLVLANRFKSHSGPSIDLPENATLADLAANLAEHHASIGLMSPDRLRLEEWITAHGGPRPEHLPPGLATMAVIGCQTWETSRGKVSLLCFVNDRKQSVHLYVFDHVPEGSTLPPMSQPRFERTGQWSMALWQDGGHSYVLGVPDGGASPKTVESYFST